VSAGKNKVHFIGIGGIGMSGLAEYYVKKGHSVKGSDLVPSNITKRLEDLGAEIFKGHSAAYVDRSIDLVVFTSAVGKDNPELLEANRLGIKAVKRAELLGEIVNDKFLIAVSGTHGKTTTSAMIAKLLIEAGLDPLVFVGGNVPDFEGGASRYGEGKYAVVEADEYDRSFLHLKSDIIVITNIDEDHLDIYQNIADISSNFKLFCENSKENSRIVYCGDSANVAAMVEHVARKRYSYGFADNNYFRISEYRALDHVAKFSIMNSLGSYNDISMNVIGKHNALNSTACFAVSRLLGIGFDLYKDTLLNFKTVDRRLQLKFDKGGIKVYDDYAHHPAEIASSLNALRDSVSTGRIVLIFQPHLYSRTRDFYKGFASELSKADEIILMDIYPAREMPIKNVTGRMILDELVKLNPKSKLMNREEIIEYLLEKTKAGDTVVFQGAGDITELCDKFVERLTTNN
jgi:UDP-N-acetylmuramate--alanine ligase